MTDVQVQDQAAIDAAAQKSAEVEAAKLAKAEAKKVADAAKAEAKALADAAKLEAKAKNDAAKAEAKAAAAEVKAKVKAEKEAAATKAAEEKAAKVVKVAKVQQPQSNGITRPRADGNCGKVWSIADTISQRIGQPVPISMLIVETQAAGLNDATTRTQYARWKTFNGVFGAVGKPAVAATTDVAVAAA